MESITAAEVLKNATNNAYGCYYKYKALVAQFKTLLGAGN